MREYGQIQCSFWQRACEEEWSNDAMLLGAYLLTGPHSNGVGCYRLPTGYVSDDLDWNPERVEKTISELSGKGFCKRFGRVVLVPKFLRWNSISNGNVAKARQQEFEAIPNDEAKKHAARAMLDFGNHWEDAFIKRLETISKGLPKQNPTQSKPTPEDSPPAKKRSLPKDFFLSDGVKKWAAQKGYSKLEEHFEYFVEKAKAKGYQYKDWDAALKTAIRDDWAEINSQEPETRSPARRMLN